MTQLALEPSRYTLSVIMNTPISKANTSMITLKATTYHKKLSNHCHNCTYFVAVFVLLYPPVPHGDRCCRLRRETRTPKDIVRHVRIDSEQSPVRGTLARARQLGMPLHRLLGNPHCHGARPGHGRALPEALPAAIDRRQEEVDGRYHRRQAEHTL